MQNPGYATATQWERDVKGMLMTVERDDKDMLTTEWEGDVKLEREAYDRARSQTYNRARL